MHINVRDLYMKYQPNTKRTFYGIAQQAEWRHNGASTCLAYIGGRAAGTWDLGEEHLVAH